MTLVLISKRRVEQTTQTKTVTDAQQQQESFFNGNQVPVQM